jgi:hypothetical protein
LQREPDGNDWVGTYELKQDRRDEPNSLIRVTFELELSLELDPALA